MSCFYGFWHGTVYDGRHKECALPEGLDLAQFAEFNAGNPIEVLITDKGFLVFSEKASLLEAFRQHMAEVAGKSCGRCTPCRIGSKLILKELEKACRGDRANWDLVAELASQMTVTSSCGIGRTGAASLENAVRYFRDELVPKEGAGKGFYALTTAPCIEACPEHLNVPRYIDYIRNGQPLLASGVILQQYPFQGTCGGVCVHLCEKACRRGCLEAPVDIRRLKRFAWQNMSERKLSLADCAPAKDQPVGPVAVIGAGPAGITCAWHLRAKGIPVKIFEEHKHSGGMAFRGIPQYRLPRQELLDECEMVEKMGAEFAFETSLGRDFTVDSLFRDGYKAVFLGIGCKGGVYLGMPGEEPIPAGYLKGIDFLVEMNTRVRKGEHPELPGDTVIVGCGNVAMDCARVARRLTKAKVHVVYRRNRKAAPADPEEIQAAIDEGVEFHFLTGQMSLETANGAVTGLKCQSMRINGVDARGRPAIEPVPGSEFTIPCTTVIAAIGQRMDEKSFAGSEGIELTRRNTVKVDGQQQTTRSGVFAGGDCSRGPQTLIGAIADGKKAAESIIAYLNGGEAPRPRERLTALVGALPGAWDDKPAETEIPQARCAVQELPAAERATNFDEVEFSLSADVANDEANRCMRCYRTFSVTAAEPIPGSREGGLA